MKYVSMSEYVQQCSRSMWSMESGNFQNFLSHYFGILRDPKTAVQTGAPPLLHAEMIIQILVTVDMIKVQNIACAYRNESLHPTEGSPSERLLFAANFMIHLAQSVSLLAHLVETAKDESERELLASRIDFNVTRLPEALEEIQKAYEKIKEVL